MKISRVFLNPAQTAKLCLAAMTAEEKAQLKAEIQSGELEKNKPLGYSYCDAEQGLSASVFISTERKTNAIARTKGGDICLNIKTLQASKKGDHVADVPAEAEAAPEVDELEGVL